MAFTPPLKMTVTAVSNPSTMGALGGNNPTSPAASLAALVNQVFTAAS